MYDFDEIMNTDPEIADAIKAEMERQNSHIELIASENWVSKAVMAYKEKTIIFGDYDVDGITSSTVLKSFLKDRGLEVRKLYSK